MTITDSMRELMETTSLLAKNNKLHTEHNSPGSSFDRTYKFIK